MCQHDERGRSPAFHVTQHGTVTDLDRYVKSVGENYFIFPSNFPRDGERNLQLRE